MGTTRTIEALTVTVTAERLGDGKEAYSVVVDSHPKVTDEWAANMLRQVADGIDRDRKSHDSQEER